MRFKYAVRVRAKGTDGKEVVLIRNGGGGRTLGDPHYYPTTGWYVETASHKRLFDPSKPPLQVHEFVPPSGAWNGTGPDMKAPYTIIEVLDYKTSDDPRDEFFTKGFASEFNVQLEEEKSA